ncbi:alpha/beta hydrolase [Paraliomyxa miuraensis]|uniref:alpha/beta hydrolase n=1 Tax=Paraliomyxa miuraensis TaxID=376150 RepID=UPI002259CFFE|nr:alpha/beta fold hydrolase [Paraliomyxa miuraensis]MCX4240779.1 alpha/beta fold hydrolase [Paraliomyxa miuraensis]
MDPFALSEGETIATVPAEDPGEGPADDPQPALRHRVWREPVDPPRATLAVLSGVMSNTAWFRPLAERWRAMGYRVVGLERRGSGLNHWSARPPQEHDQGLEDVPSAQALIGDALRELEHARAPGRPLVVVGWCWGAILGIHVALRLLDAADPEGGIDGLALLTPGIRPSAQVLARMRALAEQAKGLPPARPALESPITDEMFTAGPALDGFIRRDDARWRRFSPRFLEVSTKLSMAARMRLRKLATPVPLPMFVALAEDDATTDNAAILADLARLPENHVSVTSLPGAHGLQFDAPRALAERLDAWARDALGV